MKKAIFLLTLVLSLAIGANTSNASASSLNDAVNVGKRLAAEQKTFESAINSGDLIAIDKQYDDFSTSIKKVERAIGKVSGKSNRDHLNNTYVKPAKVAKERVIYEVSQYRLMNTINTLIENGNNDKAETEIAKLERLKKRAVDIKKAGGYKELPTNISNALTKLEKDISNELDTATGKTSNEDPNLYLHYYFPNLSWGMSKSEVKAVFSAEESRCEDNCMPKGSLDYSIDNMGEYYVADLGQQQNSILLQFYKDRLKSVIIYQQTFATTDDEKALADNQFNLNYDRLISQASTTLGRKFDTETSRPNDGITIQSKNATWSNGTEYLSVKANSSEPWSQSTERTYAYAISLSGDPR